MQERRKGVEEERRKGLRRRGGEEESGNEGTMDRWNEAKEQRNEAKE